MRETASMGTNDVPTRATSADATSPNDGKSAITTNNVSPPLVAIDEGETVTTVGVGGAI